MVFLFSLSGKSAIASPCPWLAEGTAAAVLGGSVTIALQISGSGEGSCLFTRTAQGASQTLKIEVRRAIERQCPAASPALKGIGNEAVKCTLRSPRTTSIEVLESRVRDLHFTITLTTPKPPPHRAEATHATDTIDRLAEQVAGNLF